MVSIIRKLETDGYLSLNQFVKFLQLHAPEAKVSYPTARRLVMEGKLRATMHGSQYRVKRSEVERWIAEGNWEAHQSASPYSPDKGRMLDDDNDPNPFPIFND